MQDDVGAILADDRALSDAYSGDLANLLANHDYAYQVSAFVQQSYEGASTLDARDGVVSSGHVYAREAIESVASHVLNCAKKLNEMLHLHEEALSGIERQVGEVQNRIQLARRAHADTIQYPYIRPKQILIKVRKYMRFLRL